MELSELATYARDKYNIIEEHKWTNFPGFSVLCHPKTGKWVALLIRQWDTDSGTEIQHCDLKCGQPGFLDRRRPYIGHPVRMKGDMWLGISFTSETDPQVVHRLFDRAIAAGNPDDISIELEVEIKASPAKRVWQDTLLPLAGILTGQKKPAIPERLREMRRLYEYGRENSEARARNFYRQGKFMEDYEDDYPWEEEFVCYFPTYHDMTTYQLRGYFSWRTKVRQGIFTPISASAAYIYIYELLNGIGTTSADDSLQKLREFEAGYLDAGMGDARMRANLRRWMLDLAIVSGLPSETAQLYADPDLMRRDATLAVLRSPAEHSDEQVFAALLEWGGKKYGESPVLTKDPERGRRLFCEAWRIAKANCDENGKDVFTLCFGLPPRRKWTPFSNAVYEGKSRPDVFIYHLNDCRTYRCEKGAWEVSAYEKLYFDKERFQGFLHETDLVLRRYLKTGRHLKEKETDKWALPFIRLALKADRLAREEAARPKITLDLGGLDQIRRDALTTQNSLLTEEELGAAPMPENGTAAMSQGASGFIDETPEVPLTTVFDSVAASADFVPAGPAIPEVSPEGHDAVPGLSLDGIHLQILRSLLAGHPVDTLIRDNNLMPTLVADTINEALFEEIGDSVVTCDDDSLSLVEDYIEDLTQILGG